MAELTECGWHKFLGGTSDRAISVEGIPADLGTRDIARHARHDVAGTIDLEYGSQRDTHAFHCTSAMFSCIKEGVHICT